MVKNSQYKFGSECATVLDIIVFWMCFWYCATVLDIIVFWMCFWYCYSRILNIPDKFWIFQSYTGLRIYLKISWISLDMSDYILICMNMAKYAWICLRQRLWIFSLLPSKHFNVVSRLFRGWYDVATSDKAKSTLKQRCVHQHWNL